VVTLRRESGPGLGRRGLTGRDPEGLKGPDRLGAPEPDLGQEAVWDRLALRALDHEAVDGDARIHRVGEGDQGARLEQRRAGGGVQIRMVVLDLDVGLPGGLGPGGGEAL
jgi:hypothetical protein